MRGIHTFPKIIRPKLNVIPRLEFELAYFEAAVQHFIYYAKRPFPPPDKPFVRPVRTASYSLIYEYIASN